MARLHGKFSEIRIPPQSTGPRIENILYQNVELVSISGGTIVPGMIVSGQTSSAAGTIVDYNDVTTDDIVVLFNNDSPSQSFVNGETLDIDGGSITAVVNELTDMYVNMTQIVDAENPHQGQRVDADGSAHIRFAEGEQQLDAFGITRVGERTLLGGWSFQYSGTLAELTEITAGSASSTHLPLESTLRLDCTTGATDAISITSDVYFPYLPGVGREGVFTLACGDTGKADNTRRWGLFDDDNGVFFELDDTTLYVVVRSNVTGTPVDTRVAQSAWNRDRVDGTGGTDNRSRVNLDVSLYNIYWIDYAWLGTGRVRFGMYAPDGERIILHRVENANANSSVYMTTGSLPARAENFNSALTAGATSLKVTCGAVIDNKSQQAPEHLHTNAYDRINVSVDNTENLLMNIRAATTFNSITNRILSQGIAGSTVSETTAVIVRVYEDATIGGAPSWNAPTSGSPLEVDIAGTFSGGTKVASFLVGVNETDTTDLSWLEVHTDATGAASKTYTVTAQALGATTDVSICFIWTDRA